MIYCHKVIKSSYTYLTLLCYFLPEATSVCGWMLICTVVQALPALHSTMPLFPHMKTLLYKSLRFGLYRTDPKEVLRKL